MRDGTIFLLLAPIIGGENALVLALGMRAWELVLDAVASGIAIGAPIVRSSRTALL